MSSTALALAVVATRNLVDGDATHVGVRKNASIGAINLNVSGTQVGSAAVDCIENPFYKADSRAAHSSVVEIWEVEVRRHVRNQKVLLTGTYWHSGPSRPTTADKQMAEILAVPSDYDDVCEWMLSGLARNAMLAEWARHLKAELPPKRVV